MEPIKSVSAKCHVRRLRGFAETVMSQSMGKWFLTFISTDFNREWNTVKFVVPNFVFLSTFTNKITGYVINTNIWVGRSPSSTA